MDSIPYGYCRCGCGQKTTTYIKNCTARGYVRGEPRPYAMNHKPRPRGPENPRYKAENHPAVVPDVFCGCGCGALTNIAPLGNRKFGVLPGQRFRYLFGHHRRGKRPIERSKRTRILSLDGYVLLLAPDHPSADPNGYVKEHRLVMEKSLGRILSRDELVHHKDENKGNNDVSNLEVMSRSEHIRLHHSLNRIRGGWTPNHAACVDCGRKDRKHKGGGKCTRCYIWEKRHPS